MVPALTATVTMVHNVYQSTLPNCETLATLDPAMLFSSEWEFQKRHGHLQQDSVGGKVGHHEKTMVSGL